MDNFEDRFGEGMSELGNKIKNDFISKLDEAKQVVTTPSDNKTNNNKITNEKRYILIGLNIYTNKKNKMDYKGKCIDILKGIEDQEAYDMLGDYIWTYHKENLEKYDIIYLIDDELTKIIARASSFAGSEFMVCEIEREGNLKDYHPVYVDFAEHDERVYLSELLDIDLV